MVRIALALLVLASACSNAPPEAPDSAPVYPATASPTPTAAPAEAPTATRKCPASRDNAGMAYEFSFDPDETTLAEAIEQNCSAWRTFRGQTDGKVVVAVEGTWVAWTLALWCADDRLHAVVTSPASEHRMSDPTNEMGILPIAYQFGDWESIEDVGIAAQDLSDYMEQKAEEEYQKSREFQAVAEDSPTIGESVHGITEEFWIVETSWDSAALTDERAQHRDAYRDFVESWWGVWGEPFIGMPAESADQFVDALRVHKYVVFGRVQEFVVGGGVFFDWDAFNLTGAERDVEPVLQECGY